MDRAPVTSSNIASVGHDPASKKLHIEFKGHAGEASRVYEYDGVPASAHDALIGASSVGNHFHRAIRNKYPVRRIS